MSLPPIENHTVRQGRPEITLAVCRGACRLMRQSGLSVLLEVPLPDGRRADIFAVGRGGEITIVEVKSSKKPVSSSPTPMAGSCCVPPRAAPSPPPGASRCWSTARAWPLSDWRESRTRISSS